jgi:hypothetical protein
MHNIAENGKAAHSKYKGNQEQHTVISGKIHFLTKAYETLNQNNLTESALFAYLRQVTDYLEHSFVELQNKTNSDNWKAHKHVQTGKIGNKCAGTYVTVFGKLKGITLQL